MTADVVWGVVRTLLAAGGGVLVARGLTDEGTLQSVIGALGVLFVAGWSMYNKVKSA